jgi:GntR family transcriptional regulator
VLQDKQIAAKNGRTVVAQLRDRISELITRERFKPGDKLPTEAELKERFGASRPAIREALKLLEQDGTIAVEHGRGRFLTATGAMRVDRPITRFESVTEMAEHLGYVIENRVLAISEERPTDKVRDALRLGPNQPVIRLERLRLSSGEPIVYCIDFMPRTLFSGPLYDVGWGGSLLELLDRHGNRPTMSAAQIRAVTLPEDVVRRSDLTDFGPALMIEETAYTAKGDPVVHANDYHRGSHFAFSFLRT